LDLKFIRSQFPAFEEPSLNGWGFFENAGGSYTCRQVISCLKSFYTKTKVQPYYNYPASQKSGAAMDDPTRRVPTVSIVLKKKSVDEIFGILTEKKLMAGQGHFYGVRPLMGMNIPIDTGVLRLSFLHYTTEDEIDQLIEGLCAALG